MYFFVILFSAEAETILPDMVTIVMFASKRFDLKFFYALQAYGWYGWKLVIA